MSAATLAAPAAGVAAAVAVADLGGAWGERRRRPGRWRRIGLRALARLGRGAATRAPRDLHERIARAGLAAKPGDVMAVKAAAALVVAVAAAPLISVLPGRLGPVLCAAVAGATFLLPDLWLRRRTRARARAMDAELPGVLDLLRVAIAAGLPPSRALAEVGRRHPGVLAGELRHTAAAISLGVPPRGALAALERRCPSHGIPPLVAALERSAQLGASPAASLAAQAAEARAQTARRAAEDAARAAPKIQLVIALGLVPSVLLLVAAALAPALLT